LPARTKLENIPICLILFFVLSTYTASMPFFPFGKAQTCGAGAPGGDGQDGGQADGADVVDGEWGRDDGDGCG
jgi:hypothetical protein